jgi:1,6-anhydro-N-acetylmuramate kinase
MARFEKGNSGKPKGAKNKITKTVKETVLAAFNELQEDPKANILEWGRRNPAMFYQVAAKLIPTELKASVDVTQPIIIDWNGGDKK